MNSDLLDSREYTWASIFPLQHLCVCAESCSVGSPVYRNALNPTKALFMAWMFITFVLVPWRLVQSEFALHPFP